jgi:hypothetical protein
MKSPLSPDTKKALKLPLLKVLFWMLPLKSVHSKLLMATVPVGKERLQLEVLVNGNIILVVIYSIPNCKLVSQ